MKSNNFGKVTEEGDKYYEKFGKSADTTDENISNRRSITKTLKAHQMLLAIFIILLSLLIVCIYMNYISSKDDSISHRYNSNNKDNTNLNITVTELKQYIDDFDSTLREQGSYSVALKSDKWISNKKTIEPYYNIDSKVYYVNTSEAIAVIGVTYDNNGKIIELSLTGINDNQLSKYSKNVKDDFAQVIVNMGFYLEKWTENAELKELYFSKLTPNDGILFNEYSNGIKISGGGNKENDEYLHINFTLAEYIQEEFDYNEEDDKSIIVDDTAETGATYTFTLEDVKTALKTVCEEKNIEYFSEFTYKNTNKFNEVYEANAYIGDTLACSIRAQIHNGYVVDLSYYRTYYEETEFAKTTGKEVFIDLIDNLFDENISETIIENLNKLTSNTFTFIKEYNTICNNYKDTEIWITTSTNEYYENEKNNNNSAYKGLFREINNNYSNEEDKSNIIQDKKEWSYTHIPICGCIIIESDAKTGEISYKKKCENCGNIDNTVNTTTHTTGILNNSYYCPECKQMQEVQIEATSEYK